jgi:hypothetical protein
MLYPSALYVMLQPTGTCCTRNQDFRARWQLDCFTRIDVRRVCGKSSLLDFLAFGAEVATHSGMAALYWPQSAWRNVYGSNNLRRSLEKAATSIMYLGFVTCEFRERFELSFLGSRRPNEVALLPSYSRHIIFDCFVISMFNVDFFVRK